MAECPQASVQPSSPRAPGPPTPQPPPITVAGSHFPQDRDEGSAGVLLQYVLVIHTSVGPALEPDESLGTPLLLSSFFLFF